MSDDDISIISLSDEEGAPSQSNKNPDSTARTAHAPHLAGQHGNSGTKGSTSPFSASSSKHGKNINGKSRQVEPVYEDDHEGNDESEVAYHEGEETEDTDTYLQGVVLDEDGLDYIANRFTSRKHRGSGPSAWIEVDEGEIREVAENLLQNINKHHQSENALQQIFMSSSVAAAKEMQDPLGMGTFDIANMRLKNKATKDLGEDLPVVNNKWHRDRVQNLRSPGQGNASGLDTDGSDGALRPMLPPEISPSSEGFDPERYLATFHQGTNLSQLRKGVKHLGTELSERTGQLKQLIKSNFERFISCKGTIDDIYLKLKKIESDKQGGTATVQRAIEQVQDTASQTFGDVLERAAKTDRIKSVSSLLRRFNNLFGIPGRVKSLAAEGDLQQIVREYMRANALIKPSASTARVWISLYQEIEKHVTEVYNQARARLEDPDVGQEEAPVLIVFLSELAVEKLPGTRGEDPMQLYLDSVEENLMQHLQEDAAEMQHKLRALGGEFRRQAPPSGALGSSFRLRAQVVQDLILQEGDFGAAASGSGSGNDADSRVPLLLWPGPPEWSPRDVELPPHLALAMSAWLAADTVALGPAGAVAPGLHANLTRAKQGLRPPVRADSMPSQSQPQLKPPPALPDVAAARFTPMQCAWVSTVSRMTTAVAGRLPALWAVCTSAKYGQSAAGLVATPGGRRSKKKGGAVGQAVELGQEVISRVVTQLSAYAGEALEELQQAGPMQPCMELLLMDLAHAWKRLHEAGCPDACIAPLQACLFRGFGLYTHTLAVFIRSAPRIFFEHEDWKAGAVSRDSPPVTQLPKRLQAAVGSAMRCYFAMLEVTRQVDEPPEADSWRPLQDGFFAAFATFCDCAAELSGRLADQVREAGAAGNDAQAEQSDRADRGVSKGAEQRSRETKLAQGRAPLEGATLDMLGTIDEEEVSSSGRSQSQAVTKRRGGRQGKSLSGPSASAEAVEAGPAAAAAADLSDDAKLLAVMSNASALRTHVMPALVDMHRRLLTGPQGQGDAEMQEKQQAKSAEMWALIGQLLSLYLDRKEVQLMAAVQSYLCGPIRIVLPPGSVPLTAMHLRDLSAGFQLVLSRLLRIYTEVYAHSPLTLKPVMETVTEHLTATLAAGFRDLDVSSVALEELLQLFLDLMFLEHTLSGSVKKRTGGKRNGSTVAALFEVGTDLGPAYVSLASTILKVVSRRGFKADTREAKTLMGVTDKEQLIARAQDVCMESLRHIVDRNILNIRCFKQ